MHKKSKVKANIQIWHEAGALIRRINKLSIALHYSNPPNDRQLKEYMNAILSRYSRHPINFDKQTAQLPQNATARNILCAGPHCSASVKHPCSDSSQSVEDALRINIHYVTLRSSSTAT